MTHAEQMQEAADLWYDGYYDGQDFNRAVRAAFAAGAHWQAEYEWKEAADEIEREAHQGAFATG